jgi:phosphoesterase RecJ-like protein
MEIGDHINSGDNVKIMIDHHPQPVDFVDYLISDTSVSSTSELVYEFIENQDENVPENVDIATCLLTGIVTDTGLFSHNSETIRTFEIVSKLLKMGADKKFVIDKLYNEYPYHRMQLLGNTLHNRMQFFPEFGTSYIYLSKEDQEKYNYQNGDSEGFVNIALSIAGAKFAAIFIEKEDHV